MKTLLLLLLLWPSSLFGQAIPFPGPGGVSAASPDVTSGLVGRWKFDDGSGTTAVDFTGGTNGQLQNTPTWVAGHIGSGALQLSSASSQYVLLASPTTALDPDIEISVTSWINCASFPNDYNAIFSRNVASGSPYQLFVTSTGKLAVYTVATLDPATTTLSTGVWYHVGFTYGAIGGLIVYLNGASDGTASYNGAAGNGGAADASIGEDLGTPGRFLDCTIDDTRVYNRELSASEMLQLKNFPGP